MLAVSLGGAETLIEHPASMTHADNIMSAEMKKAGGITPGLMRLRYNTPGTCVCHVPTALISSTGFWAAIYN